MWGRLCVVVLGLGLTACGLLQLRQARLQAAHELAAAHERIRLLDEDTLRTRALLTEQVGRRIESESWPTAPEPGPGRAGEPTEGDLIAEAGDA